MVDAVGDQVHQEGLKQKERIDEVVKEVKKEQEK